MKSIVLLFAVFTLLVAPAWARESHVKLEDYVKRAEAIAICVVETDNGDGTVTANILEVLKGDLGKTAVIQGDTGHCVIRGPVSRFMKPKNTYLVFLFKSNTVGRLGGILEIEDDKTLLITYIDGFAGTTFDKDNRRRTLPVIEAKDQIQALLKKS
jgi:hypothetical protein